MQATEQSLVEIVHINDRFLNITGFQNEQHIYYIDRIIYQTILLAVCTFDGSVAFDLMITSSLVPASAV